MTASCVNRNVLDTQVNAVLQLEPDMLPANGIAEADIAVNLLAEASALPRSYKVILRSSDTRATIRQPGAADANGTFVASIHSSVPGTQTITAYLQFGGQIMSLSASGVVTFNALADNGAGVPDANRSSLAASPNVATADGHSTIALKVTVKDAQGNPISGQIVTLTSSGTGNAFGATSGVTNASGTFSTTMSSTVAENKTITAALGSINKTTTIPFVAGAASSTTSTFVASPTSVIANGSSTTMLTVTVRDAYGNPIAGQSVSLYTPTLGNGFSPGRSGGTGVSGAFSTALTSMYAGPKKLTASVDGFQLTASVTFTSKAPACPTTLLLPSLPLIEVGNSPYYIALADFNNDHILDLASSNQADNTVSVVLGNSHGFGTQTTFPGSGGPNHLAAADFNSDGNQDLTLVNYNGYLTMYKGDGAGSMTTAQTSYLGANLLGVAAAKFNPSGNMDVVATFCGSSGSVIVGLGQNDVTISGSNSYSAPNCASGVGVGDFNGDGDPDVAVGEATANNVIVYFGDGNSQLQNPNTYNVGGTVNDVAVSDLNHDGKVDLVTANQSSANISVLLNQGNGSLQSAVNYSTDAQPRAVVLADYNGDGNMDIAVSTYSAAVDFLFGKGDGTFGGAVSYALGTNGPYYNAQQGKLTQNGNQALFVSNLGHHSVDVFLTTANGNLLMPTSYQNLSGGSPTGASYGALADLNGDGVLDYAVCNAAVSTASVYYGKGDGTLYNPNVNYNVGSGPNYITSGDVNNDGLLDLIVASQNANAVSVLLNQGSGTFATTPLISTAGSGTAPSNVQVADLNKDGNLDAVTSDPNTNGISVMLGAGAGTFGSPVMVPTGNGTQAVVVADFNGDGNQDVAAINASDGSMSTLMGNGDGTLKAPATTTICSGITDLVTGDVNLDGNLDIVVGCNSSPGQLLTLRGAGDGTFALTNTLSNTSEAPIRLRLGDINSDGIPDVIAANYNADNVSTYVGNGDGSFRANSVYPSGVQPVAAWAGDLNNDGKTDLISSEYSGQSVHVMLNNGCY